MSGLPNTEHRFMCHLPRCRPVQLGTIAVKATERLHLQLTSEVFLSSSTALLHGMPALSAVFIIVFLAPAFMNPHSIGLLIARLMALETVPVLPVTHTQPFIHRCNNFVFARNSAPLQLTS